MFASHTNGISTNTCRNPASWVSLPRSYMVFCLPNDGAQHLVYRKITAAEQEQSRRLKSWHPFVSAADGLLTDLTHLKIKASFTRPIDRRLALKMFVTFYKRRVYNRLCEADNMWRHKRGSRAWMLAQCNRLFVNEFDYDYWLRIPDAWYWAWHYESILFNSLNWLNSCDLHSTATLRLFFDFQRL